MFFLWITFAAAAQLAHLGGAWRDQLPTLNNFGESLCTQDAVAEYLEECSKSGPDNISPSIRLRSAVRLSVCEFRAAKVEYPESCKMLNSDETYEDCVQDFRASSQLWTTYSGNWRKVRNACFEEATPFIKTQLLDLFFNITDLFSKYSSSASANYDSSEEFSRAAASELNTTLNTLFKMQTRVDLFEQSLVTLSEKLASMMESSANTWDSVQAISDDFFHKFKDSSFGATEKLLRISKLAEEQAGALDDSRTAALANQELLIEEHLKQMNVLSSQARMQMDLSHASALANSDLLASAMENIHSDIEKTYGVMELHVGQVADIYLSEARREIYNLQMIFENLTSQVQADVKQTVRQSLHSLASVSSDLEIQVASLQHVVTNVEALSCGTLFSSIRSILWLFKFIWLGPLILVALMYSKSIRRYLGYFFLGTSVAIMLRVCVDYV